MAQTKNIINLYESTNQLIAAAIDKIVVEIFNKREKNGKAQTVLLTGCSPLVGTTSASIDLAIAAANTGRRTLLVDCDVRKAIKYKKLNAEATTGLADYLLKDSGVMLDEFVYNTNIDNLAYVPCGEYSEKSTRILCSPKLADFVEAARDTYDCVIFDFPALTIVPDAQILFQQVDGIVLLASLGETRKKQIKEAKLKIKPYADKYYGMIVNKIPLDIYRQNVRDFDYYFVDKTGEQKLGGSQVRRKYNKSANGRGGKQI